MVSLKHWQAPIDCILVLTSVFDPFVGASQSHLLSISTEHILYHS